jgi:TRAP-type uncharacterized transport system substrate-binding protein
MSLRRALRLSMFIALTTAASAGGPAHEALAQTASSISPLQAPDAPLRKASPPRKQAGIAANPYTVGFVTGPPHSTEFAMTQDIATTLAAGQETGPHGEMALRVLPMVGTGGIRNIIDVLTLSGADLAIAPVVVADRLRQTATLGDIGDKLVCITPLYIEEFHLLARPEIRSLGDLAGKTVNLGEENSATAVLGREVLDRLDVKVAPSNLGLDAALDGMREGQISATLLVSGKPISDLPPLAQAEGMHFLPIPYSQGLSPDYLPSTIGHEDYPTLIAAGASVDTVAIKSALFAYNWPAGSERFRLLETFVQTLFSRFPEFLGKGHHPKWHEVSLAAPLPGWRRFRPAERWLREAALRDSFDRFIQQNSISTPDREALFRQFPRWQQRNQGR